MGIDAVALLRPRSKGVLRRHSPALVSLEGGGVLFLTGMRYHDFESEPAAARAFLESELGCALAEVHDDARGVLMFSDAGELRATTYEGVVAEIGADGFWVPIDGSPAAMARASRASAGGSRRSGSGREDPFSPYGPRPVPTDAPLFSGDTDLLRDLAGSFVRFGPDTEVWCLLVRRTTALPPRALAKAARSSVVLPDRTTAIHGKYMEGLDAVAARFPEEYASWIAEHHDPRGIPLFRYPSMDLVRDATSYEDALARLGGAIRWMVPKGGAARAKTMTAKRKARARVA